MSDEKVKRPSVVRRTKKNGNRSQNKELRQSVHELRDKITDLSLDETENKKPTRKLQRSNSLHRLDAQVKTEQKNSREILRQYVANTHNIDIKTIDLDECAQYNTGDFPVHELIDNNNIRNLALYLLAHEEVELEKKNIYGQTALMYAVIIGDVETINLLITFGSCVNTSDEAGVTALRYAVEAGDFEIASILISHGANAETVQNGF